MIGMQMRYQDIVNRSRFYACLGQAFEIRLLKMIHHR